MKKLNRAQKVILCMGILGMAIGILGKWNNWDIDYFPFFYAGSTLAWVAFLKTERSCCMGFGRKKVNPKA
ncbi:hypothetical protein [Flagellimonas sp.]|uniref:hypothetical protein n=1 Tax=Flagellimonas sp. TaxID=2058762 RepID=UPI003B590282